MRKKSVCLSSYYMIEDIQYSTKNYRHAKRQGIAQSKATKQTAWNSDTTQMLELSDDKSKITMIKKVFFNDKFKITMMKKVHYFHING